MTRFQIRREYDPEEDIRRAEAEINRRPNLDLLEHEYKRAIELKCLEKEMAYEEKVRSVGEEDPWQ